MVQVMSSCELSFPSYSQSVLVTGLVSLLQAAELKQSDAQLKRKQRELEENGAQLKRIQMELTQKQGYSC